MPARRIRRRIRGTKPRTHLFVPFRSNKQMSAQNLPSRRRSRAARI
jgi:ribosomal protein L18